MLQLCEAGGARLVDLGNMEALVFQGLAVGVCLNVYLLASRYSGDHGEGPRSKLEDLFIHYPWAVSSAQFSHGD